MSNINNGVIEYSVGSKVNSNLYNWISSAIGTSSKSMRMQKIFGVYYTMNVLYKFVDIPTLNIENKNIEIILPRNYKKLEIEEVLKVLIDRMYVKLAKDEIERLMEKYRILLGIAPEDYKIEYIKGAISKTTTNGVIYVDPKVIKYDKNVIEYVILHQFCHLKYVTHGKGFYELVKEYMPEYRAYERELEGIKY